MNEYLDPAFVADYAAFWAPHLRNLTSLLADSLSGQVAPQDTIVDLGAGTGGLTSQLLELGPARVIAIEPSPLMSDRIAPESALTVLNRNAQDLIAELVDSAEHVTAAFLFQEQSELEMRGTLDNAARLLKPEGQLHVLAWGESQMIAPGAHEEALWDCLDELGLGDEEGETMAELAPNALAQVATDSGFRPKVTEHIETLEIPRHHFLRYQARLNAPHGGPTLDELVLILDARLPAEPARIECAVSRLSGRL